MVFVLLNRDELGAARSWLVIALKRDVRGVCLSFGCVVSTPFSPVARFAH